jgi:hypothetical protein
MVNLIDIRILLKVVTNAYVIAILRSLHPKCEMLIGTWDDKKGSSSGYSLWDRHSLLLIKHWPDIMKVVSKTWSSSAEHWLMDLMRCWKHGPWSLSHITKGPREKSVRLKKPDTKARQRYKQENKEAKMVAFAKDRRDKSHCTHGLCCQTCWRGKHGSSHAAKSSSTLL